MKSIDKRLAALERLDGGEPVYGSVGDDGKVWVRDHDAPMTRAEFAERYPVRGQLIEYVYGDWNSRDEEQTI